MRWVLRNFLITALSTGVLISVAWSDQPDTPVYMGAKFCRTCHSSADRGRYHRWLESRHARTFDVLNGAEQTDPQCLSCHTTGHARPISEKSIRKDLRGVQCEACHGPGSEYKSMRVMKDPELAREKGLWNVTREVCLKCHK